MDLLLSLPIASYFLAPTMSSWSTSLNLLFFYMTWTTLILSHPPLKVELFGVLAIRLVFWLIPSLVFVLFDTLLPSLAESIKFSGSAGLPPKDPKVLGKTFLLALVNLSLGLGLEALVSIGYAAAFKHPVFKTSTALPLPWQIIKHLGFLIVAREVCTFYIHSYLLHGRSRIAKLHTDYDHARRAPPYALLTFADHPVTFLLHRTLPICLPALILRPHLLTYFLFVGLATGEETLAMSGYSIVPGIIMGGIARRTAIHYASQGTGNYGAWGLLDWIHGTSQGRDVMEDLRAEAEKHRLSERSAKAADSGMAVLKDGMNGIRQKRTRTRRGKKTSSSDES